MLANAPATSLADLLPAELAGPPLNIFRASLHPQGLGARAANFSDWARYLLTALPRAVEITGDPSLTALQQEVRAIPTWRRCALLSRRPGAGLLVPCGLDLRSARAAMFSTLTTFGTPRDVTLDELCVDLFNPADLESERLLRAAA
jgi:hypothetical protein